MVRLGLHIDGLRRDQGQLLVRVFEKIAGVHQPAEPRRADAVEDAQQALGGARQAPVVFQSEHHAAFLGFGEAALDAFDAPLEALFLRVAGQDRLDAAVLHQLVEVLRGAPAAGVDADARAAEFVSDLDALLGVLDVLGEFLGLRLHEALVRGDAANLEAVAEGVALELAQVGAAGGVERRLLVDVHLAVQNVHAFDAQRGGLVHDRLDRDLRGPEMPIRVSGDGQLVAPGGLGVGGGADRGEGGGGGEAGGGEERTPVQVQVQVQVSVSSQSWRGNKGWGVPIWWPAGNPPQVVAARRSGRADRPSCA